MKFIIFFTIFIMTYFIYGIYISQNDIRIVPIGHHSENQSFFYDYKGVINVRTNVSNGSSSPEEVVNDAKAIGLDFIILTDINSVHKSNGYNGNLLVLNEGEYRFLDSRIIFIENSVSKMPKDTFGYNLFFTDLLSQNSSENRESLLIMAHPFNPTLTWIGPYPTGLDGIEILNPRSISHQMWLSSKLSVLWSLFVYPFNTHFSFLRLFLEPRQETALWDQLNNERNVGGYAGADAAARAIPFADYLVKFPSYQKSMEIVSNHILLRSEFTGSSSKDRKKLLQAFKNRNFYVSLDLLGDPKGFNAYIKDREQIYLMGSKIKINKNLKLFVRLPFKPNCFFEIVLIKNGERLQISNEEQMTTEIKSPGVYRVVVRVSPKFPFPEGRRWISWIYSNPFFISP